jgi:hypothetical protein
MTKGSSESISSMSYTSTSLPVDLARNMTSRQTKLSSTERGAAQATKGKGKEKAPATSSRKGAPDAEDPQMLVGSGKSINLLFSQREDFRVTPQEATTKTYIVPLDAVNQIELNLKLCDDQRKYELEEHLGVCGCLISPDSTDRTYFTDKGMRFYSYSGRWGVQLPFSNFILEVLTTLQIAPSQLTGVAWCYLNSFQELFQDYQSVFDNAPF